MRINSSKNLELLKQSYIWTISSRCLFFLFRVIWWWKKKKKQLFWLLFHIKMPFSLPSWAWKKQLPGKAKEGAGRGSHPPGTSRGAGTIPDRDSTHTGTWSPMEHATGQQDLQVVPDYTSVILLYSSGHVAAWKQTVYEQHRSEEKETARSWVRVSLLSTQVDSEGNCLWY